MLKKRAAVLAAFFMPIPFVSIYQLVIWLPSHAKRFNHEI